MKMIELLKKEYLLLLRNKKTIIMIVLLPIILGAIYQISITLQPGVALNIGVCNFDSSPESQELVSQMGGIFSVQQFSGGKAECLESMQAAVRNKEIFLGMEIPSDFFSNINNLTKAIIFVYYDNSNPTLSNYLDFFFQLGLKNYQNQILLEKGGEIQEEAERVALLAESARFLFGSLSAFGYNLNEINSKLSEIERGITNIAEMDVTFISEPVIKVKAGVYELKNEEGIAASVILGILSLFTALLLVSSNILFDKKSNFIVRYKMSGTPLIVYLLSKMIFFSAVMLLQCIAVLPLFFSFSWFSVNLFYVLLSIVIIACVNTLFGTIIGLVSENQAVAVLASLLLTLPFLFISGIFYPSELFPKPISFIARIFPLSNEMTLFKETFVFGTFSWNSQALRANVYYLITFLIASMVLLRWRRD